jgi:hypothetical protein
MFLTANRYGFCSRLVSLLLGGAAVLGAAACDREYPLAPTFCDDWCDVALRHCFGYEPGTCVSECEADLRTTPHACETERRAVIDCVHSSPGAASGFCFSEVRPNDACEAEVDAATLCRAGGEEGVAASECITYCSSVSLATCAPTADSDCEADCRANGLGTPACDRERNAAVQCLSGAVLPCEDVPSGGSGGVTNESCEPLRAELDACGARVVGAAAAPAAE